MRVAINGLGRIGRAAFKIILDTPELELVAVNDLIPSDNLAYLLQYDSVYGRYGREVGFDEQDLIVDGRDIPVYHEKDPAKLPWAEREVELVFECTGVFTRREELEKHLQAGAQRVILSAPSKSEEILTKVFGVSEEAKDDRIISCASCTTNCITPIVEVIGRRIGIQKAILNTIHAYTASQALVDGPKKDWREGRAGAANFIPTTTGAAVATTKALPQYEGKFNGIAIRGPVPVGSIADIVFLTERPTSVEEINQIFREEAESARYQGVLGVTDEPIVSSDIIQDARASIIDLGMTQVVDGDLVKILSWYDNEWGYTSQMIRQAKDIAVRYHAGERAAREMAAA
ncbi:MAG: type I glyceraldehyde-3-phosphate dehydrogenase [Candidatus Promineifilaceae bacterium]